MNSHQNLFEIKKISLPTLGYKWSASRLQFTQIISMANLVCMWCRFPKVPVTSNVPKLEAGLSH